MQQLSLNTKAIVLLTAPLLAGSRTSAPDLLTLSEYNSLAAHLRDLQREPGDLLAFDAHSLIGSCRRIVDEVRLAGLLERGMLLAQVVEQWHMRAIWVVSRADALYPRSMKTRLKHAAPPLLYGCGDIRLLERGGLAVVGSRRADDDVLSYTSAVGVLAAHAGHAIVSGGARGVDQAAMLGALNAGGMAVGVVADRLDRRVIDREYRNHLLEGRLVLVSPYDPQAGFNVGNAMQRNRLIYALADAALVTACDFRKGGTWSGATELLDHLRFVPLYVRSRGVSSPGLEALKRKGALAWPEPEDAESFDALLQRSRSVYDQARAETLTLFADTVPERVGTEPVSAADVRDHAPPLLSMADDRAGGMRSVRPAETLFMAVREALSLLLAEPMSDRDIADSLDVSVAQVKIWLRRLVEEGVIEKRTDPVRYVARAALPLFDM